MTRLLSAVVTLVWALWFGGMVMLLVSVTTLFATFESNRDAFGDAAGALFRRFEAYQLVLAALALLGTFAWRPAGPGRSKTALLVLFGLATAGAVASTTVVTPRVEKMRQRGQTATAEFKRMHGVSSGVYMAGAAALLIAGLVLPAAVRTDAEARRPRRPSEDEPTGDGNGNGHADPPLETSRTAARD